MTKCFYETETELRGISLLVTVAWLSVFNFLIFIATPVELEDVDAVEENDLAQSRYEDYEIFAEDSDDKFFQRERRSIDSIKDIPLEELDTILKKELEFWNTVNDIFKRQNRMIKNNVPK